MWTVESPRRWPRCVHPTHASAERPVGSQLKLSKGALALFQRGNGTDVALTSRPTPCSRFSAAIRPQGMVSDQFGIVDEHGDLGPVVDAEFGEDVRQVGLHRRHG